MSTEFCCLEDNDWTPFLNDKLDQTHPLVRKLRLLDPSAAADHLRDDPFTLSLADVDMDEHERVHKQRKLVFHAMGCSGDPQHPAPQDAIATAMAEQLKQNDPPSFLYHLGDIAYKLEEEDENHKDECADPVTADEHGGGGQGAVELDQPQLYDREFYAAYRGYDRRIFAVPGNHDGKYKLDKDSGKLKLKQSSMWHFLVNFCAPTAQASPDDSQSSGRPTMVQPYPYWLLDTPVAYIIGLYANVSNGGNLDDPASQNPSDGPQFRWLVNRLKMVKHRNEHRKTNGLLPKAVLLAMHYPPYSGAPNFLYRGDPRLSKSKNTGDKIVKYANAKPLGTVLQQAFQESGQRPDAVFSAHAHLYQRLTYTYEDRSQVPYLIVGSGGHSPVEQLAKGCAPRSHAAEVTPPPLPAVCPDGLNLGNDRVEVSSYNDRDFGFLRIMVDEARRQLTGEFCAVTVDHPAHATYPDWSQPRADTPQNPIRYDHFILDMDSHTLV